MREFIEKDFEKDFEKNYETNANLEFRKIPSLNFLYEINSNGTIFRNVKSKKQNKIKLDMHHSRLGYYVTFARFKGKPKRIMIHRIVAECWLGPCPKGYEVDHKDRDSRNNDYKNLRYVTKSVQMKNRDHTNISKKGSLNLERARQERKKSIKLINEEIKEELYFDSFSSCSKFLSKKYNIKFENVRARLKNHRSHILDYDVIYLNAETIHDSFKEQEIVHNNSDLTGNYTTAFNLGKQQETEMRVKHTGIEIED